MSIDSNLLCSLDTFWNTTILSYEIDLSCHKQKNIYINKMNVDTSNTEMKILYDSMVSTGLCSSKCEINDDDTINCIIYPHIASWIDIRAIDTNDIVDTIVSSDSTGNANVNKLVKRQRKNIIYIDKTLKGTFINSINKYFININNTIYNIIRSICDYFQTRILRIFNARKECNTKIKLSQLRELLDITLDTITKIEDTINTVLCIPLQDEIKIDKDNDDTTNEFNEILLYNIRTTLLNQAKSHLEYNYNKNISYLLKS